MISKSRRRARVNFAKHDDPNGTDVPGWSACAELERYALEFA
jgi:carboxylesterase type B